MVKREQSMPAQRQGKLRLQERSAQAPTSDDDDLNLALDDDDEEEDLEEEDFDDGLDDEAIAAAQAEAAEEEAEEEEDDKAAEEEAEHFALASESAESVDDLEGEAFLADEENGHKPARASHSGPSRGTLA